jgi:hypothetical protein
MKKLILILSALSFATAGCMGDESDGGATVVGPETEAGETAVAETGVTETTAAPEPPPVTHAQFVRRLDSLCRRFNRKVDKINKRYADVFAARDYEGSAKGYEKGQRLVPRWRAQVETLEVPPEDQKRFGRYLMFVERIDGLTSRQIRALRRHDDQELTRLSALAERARNQRTNVAVDLGLRECGS